MAIVFTGTFLDQPIPVTGFPLTLACWVKPSTTASATFLSLGTSEVNNADTIRLGAGGGFFTLNVTDAGGPIRIASASASYSANTWYHVCGTIGVANNRQVFMNGGSSGVNTTSSTINVVNRITLGGVFTSGVMSAPTLSGAIAEAAIWNTRLSTGEIIQLSKGFSPLLVSPQSLIFYSPCLSSPQDLKNGYLFTGNATGLTQHPSVYGL